MSQATLVLALEVFLAMVWVGSGRTMATGVVCMGLRST